jgi:dihydrodipicolinate synthase/N-acetylneuraminate lyase
MNEKIIGLIDAPFTPMKANGDVNLKPTTDNMQ